MKQTNFELTNDELIFLKEYFRTSPVPLIRYKAQAVMMHIGGLELDQISQFVLRETRTIRRWIEDFNKRRLASIFCGHVDNENANKLTRAQKTEIK